MSIQDEHIDLPKRSMKCHGAIFSQAELVKCALGGLFEIRWSFFRATNILVLSPNLGVCTPAIFRELFRLFAALFFNVHNAAEKKMQITALKTKMYFVSES